MNTPTNFQKTLAAAAIFFALSASIPLVVLAQSTQATEATLGEQINRGDFSIDVTPTSFNFTPVTITSPSATYSSYYNGFTGNNPLTIHDGRYSGGIRVTVQASDYDPGTPGTPGDDIPVSNLAMVTSDDAFNEITKIGTAAMNAPLAGNPSNDPDYTSFTAPLVILDGAGVSPDCSLGRVGTYTTYPSFRLTIPNNTVQGRYSSTITYDLMEAPTGC